MARPVKELMQTEVLVIPSVATVAQASSMLRERQVSGAPVVDERGVPVGVISRTDLALGWEREETQRHRVYYRTAVGEIIAAEEAGVGRKFADRPVADVMMPLIFSVQQNDSLRKAAALMRAEGIHRVIVLDGQELVGVLSASDLVGAVARGELVEPQ
jgi:CBS domain-containing protein